MATWKFAVSDSYAEKAGKAGVDGLLQVLAAGAEAAPGRNVSQIQEVLERAAERAGVAIAPPELHSMAGNLSLHDLEAVVVTNDVGEEITRFPVANDVSQIPLEDRSDNLHLEPNDPRRPNIS